MPMTKIILTTAVMLCAGGAAAFADWAAQTNTDLSGCPRTIFVNGRPVLVGPSAGTRGFFAECAAANRANEDAMGARPAR